MTDEPPRIWRTGERVTITCDGRAVQGLVEFASGNGQSLILGFNAILAGFVRLMPVLWDDGAFREIIGNVDVELSDPTDG